MNAIRIDRRRIVTTAIGVAIAALLLVVWASGNGLTAAVPAHSAAQAWLRNASNATCYAASDIDFFYPSLVAAIDKLPAGDLWYDGKPNLYVGNSIQAGATSMKATYAGTDAANAYIQATDAKGPVVYTYEKITTPKGRVAWLMVGEERPQPDGACTTTE